MTPEHRREPLPIDGIKLTDSSAAPAPPIAASTSFPELLTEEEAVRYLRLDTIRGLRNPGETLARYRAMGLLRGTQVSKRRL